MVAATGAIPALVPVLATPSAEPAIAALTHLCLGPTAAHHARSHLEALAAVEGPDSAAACSGVLPLPSAAFTRAPAAPRQGVQRRRAEEARTAW